MRPVEKGEAPRKYKDYKKARHDLAKRIGYYCSYCEMPVKNMIEVEHKLPVKQGGEKLNWDNFLLSCRYCNAVKDDNNKNLKDYLWPDSDNTDLAFEYSETDVKYKNNLGKDLQILAENTIKLYGLDRVPGGINKPTAADTRWISRQEAWNAAKLSLKNWQIQPNQAMAKQIALTSLNSGHYSIWCKVFENIPEVLAEIDKKYREIGLFKEYEKDGKTRKIRPNGKI